ncbi:MAG: ParB/RepB/Spo0J family partition protein [Anaerohalosphaeraceae bacterium]|nr:ParB/RepB/Spo0J family partition protein [Anaerohalosphaeraceae bacterium]
MVSKKKDKPRHLGRGLESLMGPITTSIPDIQISEMGDNSHNFPEDKALQKSLLDLSLEDIVVNPYQPRSSWDMKQLTELSESIKTNGVIQPIIVRKAGNKYEIVAGERRFRASELAGLNKIPAMVRQANDEQMLELALVENIHRTDLNPIERAKAYHRYIETFDLTQVEASKRLGEDRSVVSNYIRLLELPLEIRNMLIEGSLSMGHARAILGVPTDDLRRKLANRALAGRLSVREVEKLVRQQATGQPKKTAKEIIKPAHILDLEEKMRSQLGTKVSITARKNGQRGKIVIEFYSLDEFDSIADRLGVVSD